MDALVQYFDRAAWALHVAANGDLPPNFKSHLAAVALHACQSLNEALGQLREENGDDQELAAAIKDLPHSELIENIRNMDLHGWPIPIYPPGVRMQAMISKPGKPIELSSSHGVAVSMQMAGLTPKVHRSPKDLKHGKVSVGGATVSFGCEDGKLVVHDFSTDKDYILLEVLSLFLQQCHPLLKDRMPSPDARDELTEPDADE